MPIYTKRGDRSKTSLYNTKRRVPKYDQRIVAIGGLDELNCCLGLAASLLADTRLCPAPDGTRATARQGATARETLISIQRDLFEIAAEIATPTQKKSPYKCGPEKTKRLEALIDELEGRLPVLSNFIFPGGLPSGATLHLARTVCRRAEREVVRLGHTSKVNPEILRFLNRLSDALFMLARHVNALAGSSEVKWEA